LQKSPALYIKMRTKNKEARRALEEYHAESVDQEYGREMERLLDLLDKRIRADRESYEVLAKYATAGFVDSTMRSVFNNVFGGINRQYE